MTNNAGTKSKLNERVTQVLNSNASTDTMAVMTTVMEIVQQQSVQQAAQSAVATTTDGVVNRSTMGVAGATLRDYKMATTNPGGHD